jgi:ribosomal protein S1
MSWTRINDPKEVLREGQEVDVMVLKVDWERERISLGLRQILPDPWLEIPNLYTEGGVITGKVTRVGAYGAFVLVEGGVEGIIPQSEFIRPKGARAGTPPEAGTDVEVKIIALRPTERKMTLSLRALQPVEEAPPAQEAPREPREPREPAGGTGGREGGNSAGGGRRREEKQRRPIEEEDADFTDEELLAEVDAEPEAETEEA